MGRSIVFKGMMRNRGLAVAVGVTSTNNCRRAMADLEPPMRSPEKNRSHLRRRKQRGSEMIEFTLAFLPMLMFMFLILDVAWAVYTRATLQYAVAQGIRYAITSRTTTVNKVVLGQIDSIRTVVQRSAFGKLGTTNSGAGWDSIQVHFFTLTGVDCTTTEGCNKTQPLVEVSVESFSQSTFMPTVRMPGLGTMSPIVMSARAWDRMEGEPLEGAPLQGNPPPPKP